MRKTMFSKVLSVVLTLAMVIACFPSLPVLAAGKTLTVDKTATADGVTVFNTIAAAITAATDGDTIEIAAGTYSEPMQIVSKTGLTIVGAGADVVKVTGTNGDAGWGDPYVSTLAIGKSSNVDISGITFDYQKDFSTAADGEVAYNSTAILMESTAINVHNCILTGTSGLTSGVQMNYACDNVTFDSNIIENAVNGFYFIWGNTSEVSNPSTIIKNNIITSKNGINLTPESAGYQTSANMEIVNNTITGAVVHNALEAGSNDINLKNITIANNIMGSLTLQAGDVADGQNVVVANNAYIGNGTDAGVVSGFGTNEITAAAADIFTDAAAGDYTVVKGSAVVGAADNTTYPVAKDFAGTDRVNNTIGAYEGEAGVVGPTLKLDKTSYTVGDDITFKFAKAENAKDWIGILATATGGYADGVKSLKWAYLNGTSTAPAAALADGSCTITADNDGETVGALPAGEYTAYFCSNDASDTIYDSVTFTVEEAAPTTKVYTVDANAAAETATTFKTIAGLPILQPGDTVNIKAGTYDSALAFANVGSADSSAITIKGEGAVILKGTAPLSIDTSYNLDISGITFQCTNTNDAAAITMKDATNVNIYNCEIDNAVGDGFHVVGTWTNCKFYNNFFNANAKNITGSSSFITGCEFYNNVVNGWAGFATWFVDINNSKFYDNTFNQADTTDGGSQGVDLNGNAKGNTIKNNIMNRVWVSLPADNVVDYNCYTGAGQQAVCDKNGFGGTHSLYITDPLLDDNYRPTATSPVVTAGDAADRLSTTDKDGVTWASEMGAYAYVTPPVVYTVDANATAETTTTFKTIAGVPTLQPGDTVDIKAGAYTGTITIDKTGSETSAPIVIKGESGAKLTGDNASAIVVTDSYNVEVSGLDLNTSGSTGSGVRFDNSSKCKLTSCNVLNGGDYGLYVNNVDNCEVSNCTFTCTGGRDFGMGNMESSKVYNNTFIGWLAIVDYGDNTTPHIINNNQFVNNTFKGGSGGIVLSNTGSIFTNNIVKNNIFGDGTPYFGEANNANTVGNVVDYNLYGTTKNYLEGTHGITGDPLLKSDFTLKADSPVIGKGDATARLSTTDKAGVKWVTADMGAYAYVAPVVEHTPVDYTVDATLAASADTSFKTLAEVPALLPGDTLTVKEGTYAGSIAVKDAGNDTSATIVIKGEGNVVINGKDQLALNVSGATNVDISGISFKNELYADGTLATYIEASKNIKLHDCTLAAGGETLRVADISNCEIYNNTFTEYNYNIRFEGTDTNNKIYNNVFQGFKGIYSWAGTINDNQIVNNDFTGGTDWSGCSFVMDQQVKSFKGNTVENNIFTSYLYFYDESKNTSTFDYNFYKPEYVSTSKTYKSTKFAGEGTHGVEDVSAAGDPKFGDMYDLTAASTKLIGAGNAAVRVSDTDKAGVAWVTNDIGAYAYVETANYIVDASLAASTGNSFKTIAEVPALNAGDTLTIKEGTYKGTLTLDKAGNAQRSPIIIKGEGDVVIEGQDTFGLNVTSSNSIDISGITFSSTKSGDAASMQIADSSKIKLHACAICFKGK